MRRSIGPIRLPLAPTPLAYSQAHHLVAEKKSAKIFHWSIELLVTGGEFAIFVYRPPARRPNEEGLDDFSNNNVAVGLEESIASVCYHGKTLEVVVGVIFDDRRGDSSRSHDEKG